MSRIASHGVVRQREPRVRDKAYLGWIAKLPCVACACRGILRLGVHCAHIKIGYPEAGWRAFGHSEKSHDARAVPICPRCHQTGPMAQHQNRGGDERWWWEQLKVFPPAFCAALQEAYEAGESGDKVVRKAAGGAFRVAPDPAAGFD